MCLLGVTRVRFRLDGRLYYYLLQGEKKSVPSGVSAWLQLSSKSHLGLGLSASSFSVSLTQALLKKVAFFNQLNGRWWGTGEALALYIRGSIIALRDLLHFTLSLPLYLVPRQQMLHAGEFIVF